MTDKTSDRKEEIKVADEKEDDLFVNGSMKLFVEELIKKDPEGYQRAQAYGEAMMNRHIEDVTTGCSDITGLQIQAKEILRQMEYYGLEESELTTYQKEILADYRKNIKPL